MAPIKTAEGLAELGQRMLRLGQRHRTVLLLVDGRRSSDEVLALAAAAGVPRTCYDELLALGLIAEPAPARAAMPAADASRDEPRSEPPATRGGDPEALFDTLPHGHLQEQTPGQTSGQTMPGDDSLLPRAEPLPPESAWGGLGETPADTTDRPLEEARELLLRAVRNEAPVSGSITLMKLKRASGRDELEALLDEVEQRLRKPRRQIIAAQTMRHVRHLLSLPARDA